MPAAIGHGMIPNMYRKIFVTQEWYEQIERYSLPIGSLSKPFHSTPTMGYQRRQEQDHYT